MAAKKKPAVRKKPAKKPRARKATAAASSGSWGGLVLTPAEKARAARAAREAKKPLTEKDLAKKLAKAKRSNDRIRAEYERDLASGKLRWRQLFVRPVVEAYATLDDQDEQAFYGCDRDSEDRCLVTVAEYIREFGEAPQSTWRTDNIEIMSIEAQHKDIDAEIARAMREGWTSAYGKSGSARATEKWAEEEAETMKAKFEVFMAKPGRTAHEFVRRQRPESGEV
jgi:hypothetical protein